MWLMPKTSCWFPIMLRIKSELLPFSHKVLLCCTLNTPFSSLFSTSLNIWLLATVRSLLSEHANFLCALSNCSFWLEDAFLALCIPNFSSSFSSQPTCCLFREISLNYPIQWLPGHSQVLSLFQFSEDTASSSAMWIVCWLVVFSRNITSLREGNLSISLLPNPQSKIIFHILVTQEIFDK